MVADMEGEQVAPRQVVLLTWNQVDQSVHFILCMNIILDFLFIKVPLLAMDCWEHAFMIDYGIIAVRRTTSLHFCKCGLERCGERFAGRKGFRPSLPLRFSLRWPGIW